MHPHNRAETKLLISIKAMLAISIPTGEGSFQWPRPCFNVRPKNNNPIPLSQLHIFSHHRPTRGPSKQHACQFSASVVRVLIGPAITSHFAGLICAAALRASCLFSVTALPHGRRLRQRRLPLPARDHVVELDCAVFGTCHSGIEG